MNVRTWGSWVLFVIGLALIGSFGFAGIASATPTVPYTDPNAVGYIGLCNQAGQQITSGKTDAAPFAALAVSSQPAQAPYNNSWRTAIFVAYQPMQELPPGDWSGEQMTASSRYTSPSSPMAAATSGDDSLQDFVEDFPPNWDGFVELRMFLGTNNEAAYTFHYPVLNIQVTGDTWTAVGGGPVNCHAGTAESLESIVLPTAASAKSGSSSVSPASSSSVSPASSSSTGPTSSLSGESIAADNKSSSDGAPNESKSGGPRPGTQLNGDATVDSSSSSHGLVVDLIVVVLGVLAGLALIVVRRRRLAAYSNASDADNGMFTKGH